MRVVVSDAMTDTNAVALQSHTPDVGGSYTKYPGYTADSLIFSNRLRGDSSLFTQYTNGTAPPTADYRVSANCYVVTENAGGDDWGMLGRADAGVSSGNDTYYYLSYDTTGLQWRLWKAVVGVYTVLGTFSQTLTASNSYNAMLDMRGTTIRAVIDGVERVNTADSAITNVGLAGTSLARSDDTTGYHMDNFLVQSDASLLPLLRHHTSPLLRM